eukprot:1157577-Pelagomonas_calceolata.AAC.4
MSAICPCKPTCNLASIFPNGVVLYCCCKDATPSLGTVSSKYKERAHMKRLSSKRRVPKSNWYHLALDLVFELLVPFNRCLLCVVGPKAHAWLMRNNYQLNAANTTINSALQHRMDMPSWHDAL